jgi:hypothetical protein
MLDEVIAIRQKIRENDWPGGDTAHVVMTVLDNVLNGPFDLSPACACMGPAGFCICTAINLAHK